MSRAINHDALLEGGGGKRKTQHRYHIAFACVLLTKLSSVFLLVGLILNKKGHQDGKKYKELQNQIYHSLLSSFVECKANQRDPIYFGSEIGFAMKFLEIKLRAVC